MKTYALNIDYPSEKVVYIICKKLQGKKCSFEYDADSQTLFIEEIK